MKLLSLLALCASACTVSAFGPSTVTELDTNAYMGRWYQMYAAPIAVKTFEKDVACATADYTLDEAAGRINLVNQQTTIQNHGGPVDSIDGYAYAPDASAPGKLKVHFNDGKGAPFDVPYWILTTGPVIDGQYEYAIVSDQLKAGLFVLARDVEKFEATYEADVLEQLKELGFTSFLNKPIKTYHGDDCAYADLKSLYLSEAMKAYESDKITESALTMSSPHVASFFSFGVSTVPELKVESYLGRWYQTYASPFVTNTFEKGATCVTADYALSTEVEGRLTVLNQNTLSKDVSGEVTGISGYAYQSDAAAHPGQLKVRLVGGAPFDAPYWILALGPINEDNEYEWAVVSDQLKLSLFVLVRDVKRFETSLDEEITSKLTELGFTHFWNKPIKTSQVAECNYADVPSAATLTAVVDDVATSSSVNVVANAAVKTTESSSGSSPFVYGIVGGGAAGVAFVAAMALTAFVGAKRRPLNLETRDVNVALLRV